MIDEIEGEGVLVGVRERVFVASIKQVVSISGIKITGTEIESDVDRSALAYYHGCCAMTESTLKPLKEEIATS